MWGCGRVIRTPACWARWRRWRAAACRSIRAPRLLSRIGQLARWAMARWAMARWAMARPTAGGSGTRTVLVPGQHPEYRVAVYFAQVGDVGAGGFEDPQAQQPEHDQLAAHRPRERRGGAGRCSASCPGNAPGSPVRKGHPSACAWHS